MSIFKKKEKTEIIIADNNTELPDFRKITVPDLKQYLINGYDEIRKVKNEKEELQEELEKAKKFEDLYQASLITTNEFKQRDEENEKQIEKLNNKIKLKDEEIYKLKETINTYKIIEKELKDKTENLQETIKKERKTQFSKTKEDIINKIVETKGNISKSKLYSLIREVKM